MMATPTRFKQSLIRVSDRTCPPHSVSRLPQHRRARIITSHDTHPAAMTDSKHTTGPTLRRGETAHDSTPAFAGWPALRCITALCSPAA